MLHGTEEWLLKRIYKEQQCNMRVVHTVSSQAAMRRSAKSTASMSSDEGAGGYPGRRFSTVCWNTAMRCSTASTCMLPLPMVASEPTAHR